MEELREQLRVLESGLDALQSVQERYDEIGWQIKEPTGAKIRHVLLHLSISIGGLAAVVEAYEHGVLRGEDSTSAVESIRNMGVELSGLVIGAAQLANAVGLRLSAELPATYVTNARRFAPESEFAAPSSTSGPR